MAGRRGLVGGLEQLLRKKVLEQFKVIARENPDLILSVNFEASSLNHAGNDFNSFLSLAHENHLDPSHVVIEILDSPECDMALLRKFIESQRSLGFLIALDDVGLGPSQLDRVAELRPDFIKTDLPLVMDMGRSYSKKEMFKSVVKLASGIGAFVIAQGAETEAEALL